MAGSDQKPVKLFDRRATATPSVEALRAFQLARWRAWANLLAAQDTIPASTARTVASHSLLGSGTLPMPSTVDPTSTVSREYPSASAWAPVARRQLRLTPGSYLEARGWVLPSGMTQRSDSGSFVANGARGRVRIVATFTNGATSSGPHTWVRTLQGSPLQFGGVADPAISTLAILDPIVLIGPDGITTSMDVLEDFSEWTEAEVEIEVSGGARIGDLTLIERSLVHVSSDAPAQPQSVHAYQVGGAAPLQPQTQGPQTEVQDASLPALEPRFGTDRLLEVAAHQNDRIGPKVLEWSAWEPDPVAAVSSFERAVQVTSSTLVDLIDNTITSWAASNPGWIVDGGAYAADWGLSDPVHAQTGRSLIPVRVSVEAQYTDVSGTEGLVRAQSGPGEWVDVVIPPGGWGPHVAYGWLECQREGDSASALLQLFGSVSNAADTLDVRNVDIDFGHW